MTAALLLSLALLAPAPRPAPPADPAPPPADAAERASRIEAALGAFHGHTSPAAWRALGPGAAADLARLARDPAELPSRRARALLGLSHLGGPEAEAALGDLAGREGLPPSVRVEALLGAGRLLPADQVDRLVAPVLRAAARPFERAVAAEVLAGRAPGRCAEIRARVDREAAADRPSFDRALDRCRAGGR